LSPPHLEKVLKMMRCELLHLGCIVGKPADTVLPEWSDEAEPGIAKMYHEVD